MDRRFTYPGAIPQDTDISVPQVYAMKALGHDIWAWMGSNTCVSGLALSPTVPASLSLSIGPGSIMAMEPVDTNAFGSIGVDSLHQLIKQGINEDPTLVTFTPPSTPGQAVNYLIQASLLEADDQAAVLPYFNPASLTDPSAIAYSGPNNSGVQQPLRRHVTVQISAKAGTAATAGSQVTPAADTGWVPLFVVTVAQGQTQITGASYVTHPSAPFIAVKLPDVPRWTQGGSYAWAEDNGTANAVVATLNPVPTAYTKGMRIAVRKIATQNSGAMTVNFNGLGAVALLDQTGNALTSGAAPSGDLMEMIFDGTSFRLLNSNVTYTSLNSITAASGEGIQVNGDSSVNLNYPGLSSKTPVDVDLFSFFSQGDTHHRVVTLAALKALLSSGGLKGLQVFTASGTYTKTSGPAKALVFATGGGGAGGMHICCAGGGGTGATVISLVDISAIATVAVTIGAGGLGTVASASGASSGGDGGSTSFGSYVVATGGVGCKGSDKGGLGAPAAGCTGLFVIPGGDGLTSFSGSGYGSANGGASYWGQGGVGADVAARIGAGGDARVYGSGGGGGDSGMYSSGNQRGGNGMSGVVMVLEF